MSNSLGSSKLSIKKQHDDQKDTTGHEGASGDDRL
jgi:hypothetical protein